MADPLLAFEKVVVAFGALRILDGLCLAITQGERRAIIGPNGAGKTTLFSVATGLLRPVRGRIVFRGRDIVSLPPHRRAALGIARTFQITSLFATLSVADNVALAMRALARRKFSMFGSPRPDRGETAQIEHVLGIVRLLGRAEVPVNQLSYGEQRQVELALALVAKPRLLLLDEPAAGLSPAERAMVSDVIRGLPGDLTLILIEHDMDLALGLVDRVTCMHEGRILAEGAPDAIQHNARVQEVYLGSRRHA